MLAHTRVAWKILGAVPCLSYRPVSYIGARLYGITERKYITTASTMRARPAKVQISSSSAPAVPRENNCRSDNLRRAYIGRYIQEAGPVALFSLALLRVRGNESERPSGVCRCKSRGALSCRGAGNSWSRTDICLHRLPRTATDAKTSLGRKVSRG